MPNLMLCILLLHLYYIVCFPSSPILRLSICSSRLFVCYCFSFGCSLRLGGTIKKNIKISSNSVWQNNDKICNIRKKHLHIFLLLPLQYHSLNSKAKEIRISPSADGHTFAFIPSTEYALPPGCVSQTLWTWMDDRKR